MKILQKWTDEIKNTDLVHLKRTGPKLKKARKELCNYYALLNNYALLRFTSPRWQHHLNGQIRREDIMAFVQLPGHGFMADPVERFTPPVAARVIVGSKPSAAAPIELFLVMSFPWQIWRRSGYPGIKNFRFKIKILQKCTHKVKNMHRVYVLKNMDWTKKKAQKRTLQIWIKIEKIGKPRNALNSHKNAELAGVTHVIIIIA